MLMQTVQALFTKGGSTKKGATTTKKAATTVKKAATTVKKAAAPKKSSGGGSDFWVSAGEPRGREAGVPAPGPGHGQHKACLQMEGQLYSEAWLGDWCLGAGGRQLPEPWRAGGSRPTRYPAPAGGANCHAASGNPAPQLEASRPCL